MPFRVGYILKDPTMTEEELNKQLPIIPHATVAETDCSTTPGRGGHETQLADAERVAGGLGLTVKPYRAASLGELEAALAAIAKEGMNGLVNLQGGLSVANRKMIVEFAAKHALPAMYQATMFA
jgi:hypothetical protein